MLYCKRERFNFSLRKQHKDKVLKQCREDRNTKLEDSLVEILSKGFLPTAQGDLSTLLLSVEVDSLGLAQQLCGPEPIKNMAHVLLNNNAQDVQSRTALLALFRGAIALSEPDSLSLTRPLLSKKLIESAQHLDPTDKLHVRYLIQVTRVLAKLETISLPRSCVSSNGGIFRSEAYQLIRNAGHYQELIELARSDIEMRIALLMNNYSMELV